MHIFIFLVWLKLTDATPAQPAPDGNTYIHVDVVQSELNSMGDMESCRDLTLPEAAKNSPDFADNVAKGLTPKIVCGVAAPEHSAEPAPPAADSPGDSDEPKSSPGHGDWDKGSSGAL